MDLIERQAAIDALKRDEAYDEDIPNRADGVRDAIITIMGLPSAQPETHDKRTKTHACDCISRQAALDTVKRLQQIFVNNLSPVIYRHEVIVALSDMPSAQPDLSSYSDKLWRAAYERGKAEGQRKNGKWFRVAYAQEYKYQCEKCGRFHRAMYDFCPSCGADMREGQDENHT